ncbi:plasmid mobilization relaxosome protein MobC [uncultured Algoriphagus sp.]|uniref:plasmid mobilization protein n=1 Tax=uncultured Algoriphagus sp. TaxID=417365 RepID=UPI0030EE7D63
MRSKLCFGHTETLASLHSEIKNSLRSFTDMARPKLPKKEKKSIKFSFKMDEGEFEQLAKLCEYSDLSASEVIRSCVFKNRLPKARIPILEKQTYIELRKIGTNINQIAKHYNSNKPVSSDKLTAFQALQEKLNLLIKLLVNDH